MNKLTISQPWQVETLRSVPIGMLPATYTNKSGKSVLITPYFRGEWHVSMLNDESDACPVGYYCETDYLIEVLHDWDEICRKRNNRVRCIVDMVVRLRGSCIDNMVEKRVHSDAHRPFEFIEFSY